LRKRYPESCHGHYDEHWHNQPNRPHADLCDSFAAARLQHGAPGDNAAAVGFRLGEAIMCGELSRRIKVAGTGDELDQLGRSLNSMSDRLAGLTDGLKKVSNDIARDPRTPLSRMKQRLERVRRETGTISDYEAGDEALGDVDGALSIFGALRRELRRLSLARGGRISLDSTFRRLYRVWP
jgi:hypothetical protein